MSDNTKIECSKYCKYYKSLFCPFSEESSKIEESKDLDPPPNVSTIPYDVAAIVPDGFELQSIEVSPYKVRIK